MKRFVFFRIGLVILLTLLFIPADSLNAIPAFARKYQISCQVCHSPAAPALKGFGDEFAGNGFRMTEYESPRYFVNTGDEKLSLFRELPLAIRIDGFATFNFNDEGSVDFGSPFVVKILSGGELSEKISYYFYFLFNERGAVAGLEDAFMMYRDFLGSGVNFYIGQFQVSDPLFKGELRLTLEPYMIYGMAPGNSTADLKYDRGVMFDKGFSTGTNIVGEIVNGAGIGEAGEGYLFDKDKYKNLMLRINQDIGKFMSVGFFGYTGRELITENVAVPYTNQLRMYGPDLTLNFGDKLMVNAQYLWRTDSEIYLVDTDETLTDVMTQGGFAEIIYAPKGDMSKWYLTALFNWVDSDISNLDYNSATIHSGFLLRRNFRLVAEYSHIFSGDSFGKVSAGFVSAF